ncbi:PKD domain-containing protein [Halostella salina]|uniref:PKD domain-containing protein n=1 Tax=Halostella salina TaxID=1547897 RepID=UPI000EF83A89|nr:PKD domain-containing protein [Halostella salina]
MKELAIALLVVSVAVSGPLAGVSVDNEPPLADAGLDQTVSLGSTVLLDATGSRDPDGNISAYSWQITTPNGSTITPDCRSCGRTAFRPTTTGTYTVRVTVTDDDGASRNDTLYVNVTPGDPPRVDVTGTESVDTDSTATYTADVRRGGAPLDRVRWRVDGTVVEESPVAPDTDTVTMTRTFDTRGDHTVEAVVLDTEDQRDSETVSTTVTRPLPPTPDPSDPSGDDPTGPDDSAPALEPTLTGEQTVTGSAPFREQYTVDTRQPTGQVAQVRWFRNGEPAGTGVDQTVSWDPGRHTLVAVLTYMDGRERTATFADGTNRVTVDARPTAEFRRIDNGSTLSGAVTATDPNGNLERLRVAVNGETVAAWDASDQFRTGDVSERTLGFLTENVSLGAVNNVTVTAIDARNQRSTTTQSVTPVAEPEIVRAEFINGPVDSYHERIDASRYAAHHVVEVDLDGLEPSDVSVETHPVKNDLEEVDNDGFGRHTEYDTAQDRLIVHTYWAGPSPNSYKTTSTIESDDIEKTSIDQNAKNARFNITPSPPEIRIDITHGGKYNEVRHHGMLVDARDSFDPDGTELEFEWGKGAHGTGIEGIGKFDSFMGANLTVRDGHDLQSKIPSSFQNYYTPSVAKIEETTEGPYNATDTVQFKLYTERFHFTKVTFHEDHGIDVTPSHGADVVAVESNFIEEREEKISPDIDKSGEQFVVTVEAEAGSFTDGQSSPEVTLYNKVHPETTRKSSRLTTESPVFSTGAVRRTNLSVDDRMYIAEIPYRTRRQVMSAERRDELLDNGYRLDRTDTHGTEYVVEKRVQVQEPKYEEQTREFSAKIARNRLTDRNDEWKRAGRQFSQETRTYTETEWRDSHGGSGEYTGQSRRIQTDSPEYQTERKYVYSTSVQRTRTVTETRTIEVPKIIGDGTRSVTRTVKTEETYTKRVSHSYWSSRPRDPSHSQVATRETRVSPAEYETQYQYEYETEESVEVVEYLAMRRVQTQQAEYQWQQYDVLTNRAVAKEIASRDKDYRLGGTRQSKRWILSKQTSVRRITVDQYEDPERIVETTATVSGDIVKMYTQLNGEKTRREHIATFSNEYTGPGVVSTETILDSVTADDELPCTQNGYYSECET